MMPVKRLMTLSLCFANVGQGILAEANKKIAGEI